MDDQPHVHLKPLPPALSWSAPYAAGWIRSMSREPQPELLKEIERYRTPNEPEDEDPWYE